MRWTWLRSSALLTVFIAVPLAVADKPAVPGEGKLAWRTNADLLPVGDYLIVRFDKEQCKKRQPWPFGIFRNDDNTQDIRERFGFAEKEENKSQVSGLKLEVDLRLPGAYNGWWMKLKNQDWSAFNKWQLVLRMRLEDPATRVFKLELKTHNGDEVYPYIVRIAKQHEAMQRERGFFDCMIPLARILGTRPASGTLHELVLVFEHDRVTSPKSELLLHSIRLAPPESNEAQLDTQNLFDDLGRRAFLWFRDHRNEQTGLILDRAPNSLARPEESNVCSIAAVGYYLSALPEAIRTKQISRAVAQSHAEQVLTFLLDKVPHRGGLFFHFMDADTGQPLDDSEISCLDSAILFNGCIVASEALGGRVRELADALLDRAKWSEFIVKHPRTEKPLLALGWSRRKGLLGPMDVRSSEMLMAYFLAIGSRTHPVSPGLWYNTQVVRREVAGHSILNPTHPLFTSNYSLSWHDLRGLQDRDGVDLERNARDAALANRDFCRSLAKDHAAYAPANGAWFGISAGDGPRGYEAPGLIHGDANGTVWPMAALAALPWIPNELEEDVERWRNSSIWPVVSGPYGLAPFNLDQGWIGQDLIAIDLGSYYLNLANVRNRTVTNLFMRHPIAVSAVQRLQLEKE